MVRNLLNENQERRLATHLRLLVEDIDAVTRLSELTREGPEYERVRASLAAARMSAENLREALALPDDARPSLKRRVAAVAEVWAARVNDLRPRHLKSYGAVHPDLSRVLDPPLLHRALETLASAATGLPEA